MQVSFEEIGQMAATFQANSGLSLGQVCKLTENGTVGPCAAGDDFCGVVSVQRGGYAAAVVRGFVTLPYTGDTAPAVGWCTLAADGNGGVAVPESGGRSILVVCVENGTVTVLL